MTNLHIYLADDHQIVAEGIASILLKIDHIISVRVFPDGEKLYKAVLAQKPDLIFLDIEMPGWSGIKTLEMLKAQYADIPVLILSMMEEKSIIKHCIDLGAAGYLHKDSSLAELGAAIQQAMRGELYLSSEAQKLVMGLRHNTQEINFELTHPLSEREKEVLALLCEGMTSKEIGSELNISPRTVETHRNNLMQKFGVNSTARLIALANKSKII